MKKPLLCRLGFHKPDQHRYLVVKRRHSLNGAKYHRNYEICERCGKRLRTLSTWELYR